MPVPEVIPVAHKPGYRTATIGKFDDGQFFASVVTRAQAQLDRLLDALPGRAYTDIAIRTFQVVFDGAVFGLIVEQHDEDEREDNWAELYPDGLGFHEPWDGLYDT
ncbi:hypothetical protein [Promicromonospora sp. NPDC050249]|uniref:hypothetical protein n=1 Tax=Promicromonospora sp. NPDC050249 TaxID=3154743 RepID=UPI0033C5B08E